MRRSTKLERRICSRFRMQRSLVFESVRFRTRPEARPDRTSRRLYEDDMLAGGDVLPGFEMRVGAIFE
jgi:hypothetical protein